MLSLLGPAIGNVFSEINDAFGGQLVQASGSSDTPDEPKSCYPYHFSQYMEIGPSNYAVAGTAVWSRPECSDPVNGSTQVGASSGVRVYATNQTDAIAECQAHGYSNATRPSIYVVWDCG